MALERTHTGKVIRGVAWLSSGHVVRLVIGFFVTIQVIRYLGPDRFGIYSYLFSVIGLLAPLTAFGLGQITMRRFITEPHRRDELLGSALMLRFAGAIVAVATATCIFVAFDAESEVLDLALLSTLSFLFLPFEQFADYLKSQGRMASVALPQNLVAIAIAAATIVLVIHGATLDWFVGIRVAESVLLAIGFLVAYRFVTGQSPRLRRDPPQTRMLLREGWPLLLSSFSIMIYMRIDQIMLAQMAPSEVLGHYAAAVRIAELLFFIPGAIVTSFYAYMVRAHGEGESVFAVATQRYFDVLASVCYALLAVLLLGGTIGIVPLLGESYAPSVSVFNVLAASIVFVGLGSGLTSIMTIRGWLWTYPVITLAGAALNVVSNLLLIPRYGAMGAAWATLLSYWLVTQGMAFVLPWLRPIARTMTRSLNPVGATSRLLRGRWS